MWVSTSLAKNVLQLATINRIHFTIVACGGPMRGGSESANTDHVSPSTPNVALAVNPADAETSPCCLDVILLAEQPAAPTESRLSDAGPLRSLACHGAPFPPLCKLTSARRGSAGNVVQPHFPFHQCRAHAGERRAGRINAASSCDCMY